MVAAIVASLALAWGVGEVAGFRRSLEMRPLQAPWFSASTPPVSSAARAGGVWPNLVSLNIGVQVMNALLLPLVLGFLIALAVRALPEPVRLRGAYLWLVWPGRLRHLRLGRVRWHQRGCGRLTPLIERRPFQAASQERTAINLARRPQNDFQSPICSKAAAAA